MNDTTKEQNAKRQTLVELRDMLDEQIDEIDEADREKRHEETIAKIAEQRARATIVQDVDPMINELKLRLAANEDLVRAREAEVKLAEADVLLLRTTIERVNQAWIDTGREPIASLVEVLYRTGCRKENQGPSVGVLAPSEIGVDERTEEEKNAASQAARVAELARIDEEHAAVKVAQASAKAGA